VERERVEVREMLPDSSETSEDPAMTILAGIVEGLMLFPFFHHLWFLWFLCWLVAGFAVVAAVFSRVPRVRPPDLLLAMPWCFLWLVPLTMVTQSLMNGGGMNPGFGPDTSAGLLPMPHVLAHYAIFFGFGALLHGAARGAERVARAWWIQLPLGLLILPLALALGLHLPWGRELISDEGTRRFAAALGQVLYAWLMIFGLMGLFETVLRRERRGVRFLSDSSYWLYLVHLPLLLVGQAMLRNVDLPGTVKFTLLLLVTTTIMLLSYRYLVRYTMIGWLLNGPRTRPAHRHAAADTA